jgi:c-di-GMP-binding flagellar brake protein YcgR
MHERVVERRRAPRAPYGGGVIIRSGSAVVRAKGGNLSEIGMLVLTGQAVAPEDQPLWITLALPRVRHVLQLGAEVVRRQHNGQGHALGVRFTTMPPVIRRMLRTYVFTGGGRIKEYHPAVLSASSLS